MMISVLMAGDLLQVGQGPDRHGHDAPPGPHPRRPTRMRQHTREVRPGHWAGDLRECCYIFLVSHRESDGASLSEGSFWLTFVACVVGHDRLIRDANTMRIYGTRLLICEKNVGRLKYAFNQLQVHTPGGGG
jgi:hypothetical protein